MDTIEHSSKNSSSLDREWRPIPLRTTELVNDHEDPNSVYSAKLVLPAMWDDTMAYALLELLRFPEDLNAEDGIIDARHEINQWITFLSSSLKEEKPFRFSEQRSHSHINYETLLLKLLLAHKVSPTLAIWKGYREEKSGFVLNLARFIEEDGQIDHLGFIETFIALTQLLSSYTQHNQLHTNELPLFSAEPAERNLFPDISSPLDSPSYILLTNLDAALARMGMDYNSEEARQAAAFLTAAARYLCRPWIAEHKTSLERFSFERTHPLFYLHHSLLTKPIPFLSKEKMIKIEVGFSSPGPVDALLGVEACGLAPIFSPLHADGNLSESSLARLAHKGYSLENALAALLMGEQILSSADRTAHLAMYNALSSYADYMPTRPAPSLVPDLPAGALKRGYRRTLPARQNGFTQKATIAGHRLFLRTSEYEDGSLGEITLSPMRENSMVKGLLECFAQAVSLGLQYGVPLEKFVETFAYTHFGYGGTVEGDPKSAFATSLLDYTFRTLSDAYLGQHLPDAPAPTQTKANKDLLLPLDLPESPKGVVSEKRKKTRASSTLRLVS